jgi:hypothetical protein
MSNSRAVIAGVVGALAMTLVSAMLRAMGMPLNLEMMYGSLLTASLGVGTWLLGFSIHLCVGALLGLVYAQVFVKWTRRPDATTGVGIGAVHGLISGLLLGVIRPLHPLIPEVMPAPGIFLTSLGAVGVIVYLGLHLMFGAIVGAIYAADERVRAVRSYP